MPGLIASGLERIRNERGFSQFTLLVTDGRARSSCFLRSAASSLRCFSSSESILTQSLISRSHLCLEKALVESFRGGVVVRGKFARKQLANGSSKQTESDFTDRQSKQTNGQEINQNSPHPLLGYETLGVVLINQDHLKVVRNPGLDALKLGDAHGPEVLALVTVLVLAAPDARAIRLPLAQARNVDEHAVGHVDPAGVNYVHAVAAVHLDVVRVDVQKIRLADQGARVDVGVVVDVLGAVEVLANPEQRAVGHLHVEVVVPRHDLAVPPPAQERAVGEPRLDAVAVH